MTTQAARAERKEINKAWFYFVLSLAILSTQTAILMVPALLVEIATDLDVSVAVAGQLNTATFAAMAVSIIAVGPWLIPSDAVRSRSREWCWCLFLGRHLPPI